MHCCPPMPPVPCPPECPPPQRSKSNCSSRYIREIGTAMIGNQLIIRMERDKGKSKRSKGWDPPCDCDVVEIQRPTSKEGPKILKGADNNRILFRVQSKSQVTDKNDGNGTQAICYEIGQCKGGQYTNQQCRTFTLYPTLDGPDAQEVHTDRVTEGNENVFMLRVKKKSDSMDQPKKNIELEVRTPRPPTPPPVQPEIRQTIGTLPCQNDKKIQFEDRIKKETFREVKRRK